MKIDNPTVIAGSVTTELWEYDIDRADIGLGQTYGVLCYGLSVTLPDVLVQISAMLLRLCDQFGKRVANLISTKLWEYNIDRIDIGLGQTCGVLCYGLSATCPTAAVIPEPSTSRIPNPVHMWPGMLAGGN